MNIKFNEYSIGIYALYNNAIILSSLDTYLPEDTDNIIFTGKYYDKGIAKRLQAFAPNRWVLDSALNPKMDLTDKYKILEYIEKEFPNVEIKNKDLLCNLEWNDFCRIVKLGKYTNKINIGKGSSIYKLYDNLANGNIKDRLAMFYNMLEDTPDKVIESMLLTFIKKSRNYDIVQSSSKYKLILKTFYERNPKLDNVLISYSYKSNNWEVKDRLVWLLTNLK